MNTSHNVRPATGWDPDRTVEYVPGRPLAAFPRPVPPLPPPPPAAVGVLSAPRYGAPGFVPPGAPPTGTYPPIPWPPAAPPRRNQRRLWLLVAIGVVVVALVIGAVALVGGGSGTVTPAAHAPTTTQAPPPPPPPPPPPAPVSPGALPRLLLSVTEAEKLLNVPAAPFHDVQPASDQMYDTQVSDPDCAVMYNADQSVYQGSGYTAVQSQSIAGMPHPGGDDYLWRLPHAVVTYSDAKSAADFVQTAQVKWNRCANRSYNGRVLNDPTDDYDQFWSAGPVTLADGVLSTTMVQEGGAGWQCQHGLTAHNNVVLEFSACGTNLPASVVPTIVAAFTQKVDTL
jgi:serine/threonine kinase PknH